MLCISCDWAARVGALLAMAGLLCATPAAAQPAAWAWGLQSTNPTPTDSTLASGQAVDTDTVGHVYVGGNYTNPFGNRTMAVRRFGSGGTVGPGAGGFVAQATGAGQWTWVTQITAMGGVGGQAGVATVTGVTADPAGGVFVVGTVFGARLQVGGQMQALTTNNRAVFVARLTQTGVCQWLRLVTGPANLPVVARDPVTGDAVLATGYLGTLTVGSTTLPASGSMGGGTLLVARISPAGQWGALITNAGTSAAVGVAGVAVGLAGQVGIVGGYSNGTAVFGAVALPNLSGATKAYFAAQLDPAGQWQWAMGGSGSAENSLYGAAYTPAGALWVAGRGQDGTHVGPVVLTATGAVNNPGAAGFAGQLTPNGQWSVVQSLPTFGAGLTSFGAVRADAAGNAVVLGSLYSYGSTVQTNLGSQALTTPNSNPLLFVAVLSQAGQWRYQAAVPTPGQLFGPSATAVALDNAGKCYVTGSLRGSLTLGNSVLMGSSSSSTFLAQGSDAFLAKLANATTLPTRTAALAAALALYPTPAHHITTLRRPAPAAAAETLRIVDGLGRTVRTQTLPAALETTLDLTGLAPGLYLVRIGAATARLVVE